MKIKFNMWEGGQAPSGLSIFGARSPPTYFNWSCFKVYFMAFVAIILSSGYNFAVYLHLAIYLHLLKI